VRGATLNNPDRFLSEMRAAIDRGFRQSAQGTEEGG